MSTSGDAATIAEPDHGEQQGQTPAAAVAKGQAIATGEHCFSCAGCVLAALLLLLLLNDWPFLSTRLH